MLFVSNSSIRLKKKKFRKYSEKIHFVRHSFSFFIICLLFSKKIIFVKSTYRRTLSLEKFVDHWISEIFNISATTRYFHATRLFTYFWHSSRYFLCASIFYFRCLFAHFTALLYLVFEMKNFLINQIKCLSIRESNAFV